MRGIETPIKTLRQKVFTEVAKVAFDSQNINDDIEAIPYKITPGDAPLYRESIYRERAICSERVRLAMGLSLRPDDEPVHVTSGLDESNVAEKYYEPPLMQVIPSACDMCEDNVSKIESYREKGHIVPPHHIIKTPAQIEQIKESCKINIAILDYLEEHIYEGMNTKEIDQIVYDMTTKRGGIPAPLNYEGFPYSVCTSVNDQVCHGFPSEDVILKSGDIVNVDCSTILNGYFSDSSRMFCIGEVSPEKKRLVQVTRECVKKGLEQVKPWGFLGDMGQAVHDHAAANGYTVVREIGGHGVGLEFHEEPWVGYHSKRGEEMLLVPGMIFTIEPMVNMGKEDIITDSKNGWEVYTKDHMPSAQWEIMVLVTEEGNEVLCW